VLLVGFSLGGYVVWEALKLVPDEIKGQFDVILISAAIGDRPGSWPGIEYIDRFVNLYSSDDLALKYLYPRVVAGDESPAAGVGPLSVEPGNVWNVDVTDMVGHDHLWGSDHISELVRVGFGCMWGIGSFDVRPLFRLGDDLPKGESSLLPMAIQRLYRWVLMEPVLWGLFGAALVGDRHAVRAMLIVDEWSLGESRLSSLLAAGSTMHVLLKVSLRESSRVSVRGALVLRGLLRYWLTHSLFCRASGIDIGS
jgi:hypothetical protein